MQSQQASLVQRREDLAAVLPYLRQVKDHQGLCQAVTMHAAALGHDLKPIQAELEIMLEIGQQGQAEGADFKHKVAKAATLVVVLCLACCRWCPSIKRIAQTALGLLCLAGQGLPSATPFGNSWCPQL